MKCLLAVARAAKAPFVIGPAELAMAHQRLDAMCKTVRAPTPHRTLVVDLPHVWQALCHLDDGALSSMAPRPLDPSNFALIFLARRLPYTPTSRSTVC